ncbi:MAG: hypothetical protein IPP72_18545 [Chitinophagaceae bacterium]|nr:hypothetical protein [Chitinophagaceae bacterium]
MFRKRSTLSVIFLIAVSLSFTVTGDWIEFTSHGFSASFPKKPEADSQMVNSPVGKLKFNSFMYDASEDSTDENLVYGVMTMIYPDSLTQQMKVPAFIKGLFDGAVKGGVNSVKGKLLSEKEIEFEGCPGREVKIDFHNGLAIIRMRMYMVKATMFTLQTITYTEKDENKQIERFMNSFKLLK